MIFIETQKYHVNGDKQSLPGFDEKYANIVDYILKITEDIWEQRAIWVIYDTYSKDIVIHSGALRISGVEEVVIGTVKTLAAFPDRKMTAEAVIWSKVDKKHFYSSHRIGSTATNTGKSVFGPSTGKQVFFRTIADCLITENKIIEEWLVRDNLYLVQQLGFDPVVLAKQDTRYQGYNLDLIADDMVKELHARVQYADIGKPADLLISLFQHIWERQNFDNLDRYYHSSAKIHAVCGEELTGIRPLKNYLEQLLMSFSSSKVSVERVTCNVKEEETEVAVRWKIVGNHSTNGFFGSASGKRIVMPGISHFLIKSGKIAEEWLVFDGFDVLCQIHADSKHNSRSKVNGKNLSMPSKKILLNLIDTINQCSGKPAELDKILHQYFSEKVSVYFSKPFKSLQGIKNCRQQFYQSLFYSFPDLEIQPYIVMGGHTKGADQVSMAGNFIGTFQKDWLGIPAHHHPTWIRFHAHFIIENSRIVKAWYLLDVLDVMRQAGYDLFPSKGVAFLAPIPMTGNGIITYPVNAEQSKRSFDLTESMIDGLLAYDGKTLDSMGQERFWDTKNMMWYGPGGIGATKGLKGFQKNHQIPFLTAFPDRGVLEAKDKNYFTAYAEGNYTCHFGFPAMYASHRGDGWLGLKATEKKLTMRVMDFWRREDGQLKENWVMIDVIDILEQLNVNVFKELEQCVKEKANS